MKNNKYLISHKAGKKAKDAGNYFESIFEFNCENQKISYVKIPTGSKIVRSRGRIIPVNIKTPFDYVIGKNGKAAFLDCKTIESGNFSYSMIVPHQLESLVKFENEGFKSGYLIFYRDVNKVVFFNSSQLSKLSKRQSIDINSGMIIGDNLIIDVSELFEQ